MANTIPAVPRIAAIIPPAIMPPLTPPTGDEVLVELGRAEVPLAD